MQPAWLALALVACSSPPPGPSDGAAPLDQGPVPDGSAGSNGSDGSIDGAVTGVRLPPDNAGLDYQLGGAYPPPAGVGIVSRDRLDAPAAGLYNVCYVNGFQIQPGDEAMWQSAHPSVVLVDGAGHPVIDTAWNETLLDTSSAAKRTEILAVIGPWIDGCAHDGFDAVEIDNLDSYSRSTGLLTTDDNVAMIALFAARAHGHGLAIAQKNASELVARRTDMGTDFVVAEECNRYTECDAYTSGYGTHVLMIEYRRADFTAGCASYPNNSIVLRDQNLVPAGTSGYLYDGC